MTTVANTTVKDLRKSVSVFKKKNHPAHSSASRAYLHQYIQKNSVPLKVTKPMKAKKIPFSQLSEADRTAMFQKSGKGKAVPKPAKKPAKKPKRRVQLQPVTTASKRDTAFLKAAAAAQKGRAAPGTNQAVRLKAAISSIEKKAKMGAYDNWNSNLGFGGSKKGSRNLFGKSSRKKT